MELVKVRGAVSSNDGIVQRSEWDAAKYLASGRLKEVMPAYSLPPADLHVYYPSRDNLPAKVRAFINFLVTEFSS